jgi:hypothetical protein
MNDDERDPLEERYNRALLRNPDDDAYDLTPGELLTPPATAVIVGIHEHITVEQAARLQADLERRFPGVRFALIDGCSAITTFTFDPEATP